MKKLIYCLRHSGWLVAILIWSLNQASIICAPAAAAVDYEEPKLLVGNLFSMDSGPRKLLYKSQRTGVRSGTTVKVSCDYTYPDGSVAARDRIVYENGRIASFTSEELQTGEKGTATFGPDPKHPGQRRISFEYTSGPGAEAKTGSEAQNQEIETLVDDMISAFIVSHWDTLMAGSPAKFRYIALSRMETVGFKLVKDSETTRQGKPAIRIKMEPASIIIAQLVDPLYFIVEKAAPHRIFEYLGRTTPMMKNGNKWKDLDADTVFEWP